MDISIHRVLNIKLGKKEKDISESGRVYFYQKIIIEHIDYHNNLQETELKLFGDRDFQIDFGDNEQEEELLRDLFK